MDCKEIIVDMRNYDPEQAKSGQKTAELLFRLNQTFSGSEEYQKLLKEIFGENLGENSFISAPVYGACVETMKIGKNCFINSNLLAMARGGITIEDDVMIAGNVQLLTNNHDVYDRQILTCKPILIQQGAWIGAGVTILPGVSIGRYAIVGAASVVTKDVPDYGVVVGNPAKIVKMLDPEKFEQKRR